MWYEFLVIALTGAPGALDEQHRLEGEDVGPDEPGDDVDDPRVEHVALVDLLLAMQHVDAQRVGVECVDVVEQLADLVAVQHAADDQEAVLAVAPILVDGDVHADHATARRPPANGHNALRVVRD